MTGRIKHAFAAADIRLVSWRSLAPVAVAAGAATILGGCGATTAPSPPVSATVVQRAERSVVTVRCVNVNIGAALIASAVGTGFVTSVGVVTASHVVSTCAFAGPGSVSAGPYVASVSRDDPAHDLAVMPVRNAGAPLELSEALPARGDSVELLGLAGGSTGVVMPIAGTVLSTGATVTLYGERGAHETLTDAIEVSADGVIPGDSGGPAIDGDGRVIGVVEGSGGGRAYLTPASQITALTS